MNSNNHILELLTEDEWKSGGAVLQVLRPNLSLGDFLARREVLLREGYKFIGLICDYKIVSVASYTLSPHAYGRELLVHDMATAQGESGKGHGSTVLKYLEEVAAKTNSWRIFVHTKNAKGFYLTNGYKEYSTGLIKSFDG